MIWYAAVGAEVVYGIMDARKRKPATGWVRADGRATAEAERDVAELKQRIAELELEIERKKKTTVDFDKEIAEMPEEITIEIIRNKYCNLIDHTIMFANISRKSFPNISINAVIIRCPKYIEIIADVEHVITKNSSYFVL